MRLFLFLLAGFLVISQDAFTQELYEIERAQNFDSLFEAGIDRNITQKFTEEDKGASPEEASDLVDRFFFNCLNLEGKKPMPAPAKEHMCKCSAAKIMEIMQPNDIGALFSKGKETEFQRIRFFNDGLLPCMEQPVAYVTDLNCLSDPETKKQAPEKLERVCKCIAPQMKDYFSIIMGNEEYQMKLTPEDLFYNYIDGSIYRSRYLNKRKQCIWTHEYGW